MEKFIQSVQSFAVFDLWFYGGILIMSLSGLLLISQAFVFFIKRNTLSRKLDEEYGQPHKYNIKDKGN